MKTDVNKIRNADFSKGRAGPSGWSWTATAKGARWQRGLSGRAADAGGVTITTDQAKGGAFWSQVVVCKPGVFYRIEATVTCDLSVGGNARLEDVEGVVVAVEPVTDSGEPDAPGGSTCRRRLTPGLQQATEPIAIRTYYEAPEDVRRLRVSVGVIDARGTACIHHVRFIEILEPEEASHPLAIPPPSHSLLLPLVAKSVCICSATASDRLITQLLSTCLGEAQVETACPRGFQPQQASADAVLLPDAELPRSIRSLTGLMKLAADRIVVVALPAFAKLAGRTLSLRRVVQDDDPINAQVAYACYATRGFALQDVFAYAWPGKPVGSFVQNHFRKTAALKKFCDRHGFVTLLTSMCDQDVTSERPICLYKETLGGGLFVLDIEPVEAPESTFGEPALAMHLLLSILGQSSTGLGQYTVPPRREAYFREQIQEMATRFEPFVVHDADLPIEEVTEQLVTVGREDQTYGLPLQPKPVIVVRSGLSSGDVESVYGGFVWFKQFVRMEPHLCPYAQQLASQFRLAWVPCVAPWEQRDGWRRTGQRAVRPMTIETDDADTASLIDLVSSPINQARIVIPNSSGEYQRYAAWLPRLHAAFTPGRLFALSVNEGERFCRRDRFAWGHVSYNLQVVVDPQAFQSDIHREVIAAGGRVVRIEIPGCDADFPAHSIQRTGQAATLLEHVIGMEFGLIAVNRSAVPLHFDGFSPIAPGEALVVDRRDPMLRADASQVG